MERSPRGLKLPPAPISRRGLLGLATMGLAAASGLAGLSLGRAARADDLPCVDPAAAGWSPQRLAGAEAEARRLGVTAVTVLWREARLAEWGDVARKVDVASVRKSLVGALIGRAVAEGRLSLAATLADLGIDDTPPSLTPEERRATLRDLLMARSGVYHPAAHETAPMKRDRPARGSHPAGSFWFYNNWDFNALGTVYRRASGEDIFAAFASQIAMPLGMQDFTVADGRYAFDPVSEHPAYVFRLTARDAARFGQLYLRDGVWNGQSVVPADWVKASTTAWSQTDRGHQAYGYLWWVPDPARFGARAAYAAGFGGQMIAVLPAHDLVIAVTTDWRRTGRKVRTSELLELVQRIIAAAPV